MVKGYLEEKGVLEDFNIEIFMVLKCEIDNWRWVGVFFYVCIGK